MARFEMPNGSYPIDTCADVSDAAKLAHHSSTYSFDEVKAHVLEAKRALGCPDDVLPESWSGDSESKSALPGEGVERRYLPLATVGLQIESRGGAPTRITGHAAVFDQTVDIGFWKERVKPRAFLRTIQENRNDIAALIDHEPARVLGRISNGRLTLIEDEQGLAEDVRPTDTSYARDLMVNIHERNVTKQSFGFHVPPGGDRWVTENGHEVRELVDIELYDVSPVTYPAYQGTDVQVRSQAREAGLDLEGLSRAFVRQLRGLDLSPGDRDILRQALERLPILQRGNGGQAPPISEGGPTPSQAWRVNLLRRRFRLAAHG